MEIIKEVRNMPRVELQQPQYETLQQPQGEKPSIFAKLETLNNLAEEVEGMSDAIKNYLIIAEPKKNEELPEEKQRETVEERINETTNRIKKIADTLSYTINRLA